MNRLSKIIIIFLINIAVSFSSYSAIVSDNDGSAFVTKAEFDALKNNFNKQIEDYNASIDGKIDGAIASYLAGIRVNTTIEQKSLINLSGETFNAAFAYPATELNTGYQGYIHMGYGHSNVASSTVWEGEWKLSNDSGSSGQWQNFNSGTKSKFLKIEKVKYGGNEYWKPTQFFSSLPKSGIKCVGWDQNQPVPSPFNITQPAAKTFTFTETKFGTMDVSFSITLGGSHTVNGFYFNMPSDENLDWSDMDKVPGKKVTVADLTCVDADEINDVGPNVGTCQGTVGWRWIRKIDSLGTVTNWYNGTSSMNMTAAEYQSQKVTVYRHKTKTVSNDVIINSKVSSIMNKAVYYHNGLPLFTADTKGKAKIRLKFTNSSSDATLFSISNAPFSNVDITGNATGLENAEISSYTVNHGEEVELKWDAKTDETYWIKALPANGITKIESVSIIVNFP